MVHKTQDGNFQRCHVQEHRARPTRTSSLKRFKNNKFPSIIHCKSVVHEAYVQNPGSPLTTSDISTTPNILPTTALTLPRASQGCPSKYSSKKLASETQQRQQRRAKSEPHSVTPALSRLGNRISLVYEHRPHSAHPCARVFALGSGARPRVRRALFTPPRGDRRTQIQPGLAGSALRECVHASKRVLLCGLRGLSPQLRGDADILCVCCDGDSLGGAFGEARFYARAQVYNERSSQDAGVRWRVYVLETLSVSFRVVRPRQTPTVLPTLINFAEMSFAGFVWKH